MRILHVDAGREMRGGQWQVMNLLEGLERRSIESWLLAPRGSPLLEAARARFPDVEPLSLARLLRKSEMADLIHAHDARSHGLALAARKRLVVSRRVAFDIKGSLLSRLKYRRATYYLAVSEFVKERLVAAGVGPEKIRVVYDGVAVPEEALPATGGCVLAMDSPDPGKGKALIEAAGKGAGVEVHFSRNLGELSRARMFVYISSSEGLGSAALLAMAHGVPVIASRTGGLPEIVVDNETGLLTENNVPAIAAAIGRLRCDDSLCERLGTAGRLRVQQRFTIERMADATIQGYERALN